MQTVQRIATSKEVGFIVTSFCVGIFWGSVKHFTNVYTVVWVGMLMVAFGTLATYAILCLVLKRLGYEVQEDGVDSRLIVAIWTTMAVCSLALWFVLNAGPFASDYEDW